ncbi:MFS transporter [Syntrophomonas wolfei]|jgi:MFS family permease|uniref:MFS transporter n=1 Tax=Syntrophomonas wolfei TaxID=863 RepID=A0A354YT25_9FIRM|nr:MFS transporter [Syntrophomonas wolfei]HBK52523.1 MFS transporter [Syntrophomonas wolfei]
MSQAKKAFANQLLLFAVSVFMMGLYSGLYDPSFNNYLSQVHQLGEVARGGLEFPRELPGFLVVFVFTALAFFADSRIAMLAALIVGISLWGQGFLAPNMRMVVLWMLLWSTGAHLFMVLKSSISLRLAVQGQEGRLLGQLGALEAAGALCGMLVVYLGVSQFHFSFGVIFGIAGTFALLAALCLYLLDPKPIKRPPHYLLFKKKYSLYYLLSILFGARKQVFLTFAPWVLIKVFNTQVQTFALLGLIGTVVSLGFRPLLGRAIDAWGERLVIFLESAILVVICILYGFSLYWFSARIALVIIMICYIVDQLLFAVTMARSTYLNRIADSRDDVAPTLSMGTTLDHGVSMTIPFVGGIIWALFGFHWVFVAAAVIALLNMAASLFIPGIEEERLNNRGV